MPLFRRKPPVDVAEIVKATLAAQAAAQGARTYSLAEQAAQARQPATVTTGGWYNPLPRLDPPVAFGPDRPLPPAPFDPPDPQTGRAGPRRWQYPVSWNVQVGDQRPVPWTVLRQAAEIDLARRCIDLRISDIVGLDWDITLTDAAVNQQMEETGEKSKARAAAAARQRWAADITAAKAFWETPDREADQSFSDWLTRLLEQQLVYDAACVWPQPTLSGRSPVEGIAAPIHSLRIVDGSTIKPLLDHTGGPPRPPQPAYQQILFGFPRGEWALSGEDDGPLFPSDHLVYRRRYPRVDSPYGYPAVEKCLPMLDIWLKRQEWIRGEYQHGTKPDTWMKVIPGVSDADSWTPTQRSQWELAINADLAGKSAQRRAVNLLPPGLEPVETRALEEMYRAEFDEWVTKTVGAYFDVMPTQLGIVPRSGLGGKGHQEGEEDKMQAQARRPTVEWLVDLLNDLNWRYLGVSRTLTFRFHESSEDDDPDFVNARAAALLSGQMTLNDQQNAAGRPLYDFANADRPFILQTGAPLIWLDTGLPAGAEFQAAQAAKTAPVDGSDGGESAADDNPGSTGSDDGTLVGKAAEAAAYRRWVRRNPSPSREFTWKHHRPVEADELMKSAAVEVEDDTRRAVAEERMSALVGAVVALSERESSITVNTPDVVVHAAPPPVVNVAPPPPPPLPPPPPRRSRRVERDEHGNITRIVEED